MTLALSLVFAALAVLAVLVAFLAHALRARDDQLVAHREEEQSYRDQTAADLRHLQHALLTGRVATASARREERPSYASGSGWST